MAMDERIFTSEAHVGVLAKRGRRGLKRWQERYCALLPAVPTLFYYASPDGHAKRQPPKTLELDVSKGVIGERGSAEAERTLRVVGADGQPLLLRAKSKADADAWCEAFARAFGARPRGAASRAQSAPERGAEPPAAGGNAAGPTRADAVAAGVDFDYLVALPADLQDEVLRGARVARAEAPPAGAARPAGAAGRGSARGPSASDLARVSAPVPSVRERVAMKRASADPQQRASGDGADDADGGTGATNAGGARAPHMAPGATPAPSRATGVGVAAAAAAASSEGGASDPSSLSAEEAARSSGCLAEGGTRSERQAVAPPSRAAELAALGEPAVAAAAVHKPPPSLNKPVHKPPPEPPAEAAHGDDADGGDGERQARATDGCSASTPVLAAGGDVGSSSSGRARNGTGHGASGGAHVDASGSGSGATSVGGCAASAGGVGGQSGGNDDDDDERAGRGARGAFHADSSGHARAAREPPNNDGGDEERAADALAGERQTSDRRAPSGRDLLDRERGRSLQTVEGGGADVQHDGEAASASASQHSAARDDVSDDVGGWSADSRAQSGPNDGGAQASHAGAGARPAGAHGAPPTATSPPVPQPQYGTLYPWDRATEAEGANDGDERAEGAAAAAAAGGGRFMPRGTAGMAQLDLTAITSSHPPARHVQPAAEGDDDDDDDDDRRDSADVFSNAVAVHATPDERDGAGAGAGRHGAGEVRVLSEQAGPVSYRAKLLAGGRQPSKLNMAQWEEKGAAHGAATGSGAAAEPAAGGARRASRNRRASLSTLRTLGAGTGGLDELRAALEPSAVRFALVRLEFGSGAFAVTKIIFVHSVGEATAPLERARATAHKFAVQTALGLSHAAVGLERVDECCADVILPRVAHLFAQEGAELGGTVSKLKHEYAEMLKRALEVRMPVRSRGTAKELGLLGGGGLTGGRADFGASVALRHVREQLGPFNWLLLKPARGSLELVDAGSLSLKEMVAHLDEREVLYGLLRMGFGSGLFRRTKWVGIWWNGPEAKALTRGKAAGAKEESLRRIEPFSLTISASSIDELSLERVLEKVRRAAHIDGDGTDSARGANTFSAATFEEALAEEVAASAAFFGDQGAHDATMAGELSARAPAEVAKDVVSGTYNWASFGLDDSNGEQLP